jgi:formylglycine-generating enzyme required for sulfatase activity
MKIAEDNFLRTGYRLPTNEEWECFCRSETTSSYGFGEPVELLGRYAWYLVNAESHMWPVGMKLPNRYGAFDMHGNVWEYCHSLFELSFDARVLRGGSFRYRPQDVRSASQFFVRPTNRALSNIAGFRPARTMPR